MESFDNIFNSNYKEHPETPEEFGDYKLAFLSEHEKSYKELGDVLQTKDDQKGSQRVEKRSLVDLESEEEDLFDLEVQIKLRRYTSFQNGFLENHRKVLKNSLQEFLIKITDITKLPRDDQFQINPYDDLKAYVFNEKLFNQQEIQQNKQRLLTKVDEYRILREILQSFSKQYRKIMRDAMMMGVWILKHSDNLVERILHQNSICLKQVSVLKSDLLSYLSQSPSIQYLKEEVASETQSQCQFNVMVESWLYTLLIAKLGYFDNDSYDTNVTLEEHLLGLIKQEKRQHSLASSDLQDDDEVVSLQCLSKKRKI